MPVGNRLNCFRVLNSDPPTITEQYTNLLGNLRCIKCFREEPEDAGSAFSDLYNCNLCPNDIAYFQPVQDGDYIYFQFNYDDKLSPDPNNPTYGWNEELFLNVLIEAKVIDYNTEAISQFYASDFGDYSVGVNEDEDRNYQNLRVDVSRVTPDCFVIEFTVKLDGVNQIVFYSEPYSKLDCRDTVQVEGIFNELDGDEEYYKPLTNSLGNSNLSHRDLYRIPGELSLESYSFQREVTEDNRLISSQVTDGYKFRTKRIPPYVAKQIANTFGAKEINVDGVKVTEVTNIDRNNDIGTMWMIEADMREEQKELNYLCT